MEGDTEDVKVYLSWAQCLLKICATNPPVTKAIRAIKQTSVKQAERKLAEMRHLHCFSCGQLTEVPFCHINQYGYMLHKWIDFFRTLRLRLVNSSSLPTSKGFKGYYVSKLNLLNLTWSWKIPNINGSRNHPFHILYDNEVLVFH